MKMATWGSKRVDMLEYRFLAGWAGGDGTTRYRDLPPLGQLPGEQSSLEKRPILGDLTLTEQAYIRAHFERRHMFRATMELMAQGLRELDLAQANDTGAEIKSNSRGDGPDPEDPIFIQRMQEYRDSSRFDGDYKRRILGRTGTWLGLLHEPYLLAQTQPYAYARAGALAIRSSFEAQKFTGNAVWDLMRLGGLQPPDINAIQKLFITHGVIEYCKDPFDSPRPNPVNSPMQIVPDAIGFLEGQDFYDIPLEVVPQ